MDAAVRAAEDGRTGPLPTLAEAIAAVTESMSGDAGGEEMKQGDAVTRQTQPERVGGGWWFPKYDKPSAPPPPPPAPPRVHRGSDVFDANGDEVPWEGVVAILTAERDAAIRERNQIRENAKADHNIAKAACDERDAAIREREKLRGEITSVRNCLDVSRAANDLLKARVAELEPRISTPGEGYCAAQAASGGWEQSRGWLTQEERELISGITDDDEYTEEGQNIAKALLARSTPPEVVLPVADCSWCSDYATVWRECLEAVRSSLAAAGVAVKEVGSE
jgi:hypothetical protein